MGMIDELQTFNYPLCATTIYQEYIFASGLTGYWSLGDGSGSAAADGSGNGSSGTLSGGTAWTNGPVGGALHFNGSTGLVTIPDNPNLRQSTNMTVCFWMNADSFGSQTRSIINKGTNTTLNYAVSLGPSPGNQVIFSQYTSSGGLVSVSSTAPVSIGVWHHVAAVIQGNEAQLYLDGGLSGTTILYGSGATNGSPVYLGTNFAGSLAEVRVYNRALSEAEVQTIYTSSAASFELLQPLAGANFWLGETINLVTSFPTNPCAVLGYQFYSGSTLLGTNLSGGFPWTPATNGTYTLSVEVLYADGAVLATPPVTVTVEAHPQVNLTGPTNGAVFYPGSDITMTAGVTNTVDTVTNVSFYINGALFGSDATFPFSMTKCCWSSGTYVLTAVAEDTNGFSSRSAPVTITVGNPTPTGDSGWWDAAFGTAADQNVGVFTYAAVGLTASGGAVYFWEYRSMFSGASAGVWTNGNLVSLGSSTNSAAVQGNAMATDGVGVYLAGFASTTSNEIETLQLAGTNWANLGDYLNNGVSNIAVVNSEIYVGGAFTNSVSFASVTNASAQYLAVLNRGSNTWDSVGNGLNGPVYAIGSYNGNLVIGGSFTNAGGNTNANYLAMLVGNTWTNLGAGINGYVNAIATCGSNLFVGGFFTAIGANTNAQFIAQWNGRMWSALASGLVPNFGANSTSGVYSISVLGNVLYAGGCFFSVTSGTNSIPAANIAKATWSEATQTWSWSDLDGGVYDDVPSGGMSPYPR